MITNTVFQSFVFSIILLKLVLTLTLMAYIGYAFEISWREDHFHLNSLVFLVPMFAKLGLCFYPLIDTVENIVILWQGSYSIESMKCVKRNRIYFYFDNCSTFLRSYFSKQLDSKLGHFSLTFDIRETKAPSCCKRPACIVLT